MHTSPWRATRTVETKVVPRTTPLRWRASEMPSRDLTTEAPDAWSSTNSNSTSLCDVRPQEKKHIAVENKKLATISRAAASTCTPSEQTGDLPRDAQNRPEREKAPRTNVGDPEAILNTSSPKQRNTESSRMSRLLA